MRPRPVEAALVDHPRVHRRPYHTSAVDDGLQDVVGLLSLARSDGAAVLMAGEQRSAEDIQLFAYRRVGRVGYVQDHAELVHLLEQRLCGWKEAAVGACGGAVRVCAETVVGQADDAQAVLPPLVDLLGPHDRVRALHADHEADRHPGVVGGIRPGLHVGRKRLARIQDRGFALGLQQPIVRKLTHGAGIGQVLSAVFAVGMARPLDTRDNLDEGGGYLGLPHLREAGHRVGVGPASVLHGTLLSGANAAQFPGQVPVP